jgi:hypothetical protein
VIPADAVSQLVQTISALPEFAEDDLYAALKIAGASDSVADMAIKFTQIAFGRAFLDGLGMQFSPEYLLFDGEGNLVERGLLEEQSYFVAAMSLAPQCIRSPGCAKFALMSADVQAVNSALHAGSRPQDLVCSLAAVFVEPPTAAGLEKAQQLLTEGASVENPAHVRRSDPAGTAKKQWWKFW